MREPIENDLSIIQVERFCPLRFHGYLHLPGRVVAPGMQGEAQIDPFKLIFLGVMFIGVIVAVVVITQGQRKIPIQYAKRVVGRRIYGGQSTYIPLKVNQSGVIPILFAQSIILFPATIAGLMPNRALQGVANSLMMGQPL